MDLASHYGHLDLALQLRHYGGKHTCESERDVAIAQRDLAEQQLRECTSELEDARHRLRSAKEERDALRVERDRLQDVTLALERRVDALGAEKSTWDATLLTLTEANKALSLQLAQEHEALLTEQSARQNAVQSWHMAQQVIAEVQDREMACREREEEALRLRNEALQDRDVARDLARLAQLDQGLAKQSQLDAEREREAAFQKLHLAEASIAAEKEVWAKKMAKTELERKNIQHEIDLQTEKLRAECDRLDSQLHTANNLAWTLKEELVAARSEIERLKSRTCFDDDQIRRLRDKSNALERQVQTLLEERRSEHAVWRQRIEEELRAQMIDDLRRMLAATIAMWQKLEESQKRIIDLDAAKRHAMIAPLLANGPLVAENSPSPTSPFRPTTTPSFPLAGRAKPTLLPRLPDRSSDQAGRPALDTSSHSRTSDFDSNVQQEILQEPTCESPCELPRCTELSNESVTAPTASEDATRRIASARAVLNLSDDQIDSRLIADQVTSSSEVFQQHLEVLLEFVSSTVAQFR
ncbi:hypothetical protein PINS_up014014 [Pythium insidiosum]|nr:hypothetical protein PINS_up014014 [Pythium insidiosum]